MIVIMLRLWPMISQTQGCQAQYTVIRVASQPYLCCIWHVYIYTNKVRSQSSQLWASRDAYWVSWEGICLPSGKTRVWVPAPSLPSWNIIYLFIYVIIEHLIASQRGPAAAGAIEGGVEPPGIAWYDIIHNITSNIISYVHMISYMILFYDIMLHIIVCIDYDIAYDIMNKTIMMISQAC